MPDPEILQIISYDATCGTISERWLEHWIDDNGLTIADIERQLDKRFIDPSDSYLIIYDLSLGDSSQPITYYSNLKQTKRRELQEKCARDHRFGQF